MNKNLIKEISIKNVGQHQLTNFRLGSSFTVIAAANGSGKSTFVNILDDELSSYINLEILDMQNAEIELVRCDTKKNSIVFNEEKKEFDIKRKKNQYQPEFSVFNDQKFNQVQTKHHKGNLLISLNKEFNEMQEAKEILGIVDEVIANGKRFEKNEDLPQAVWDKMKTSRINLSYRFGYGKTKESYKKDAVSIVNFFNKHFASGRSFKRLGEHNVRALSYYIRFENKEKVEAPIMKRGLYIHQNAEEKDFEVIRKHNKRIPTDAIEKIANLLAWISYFDDKEYSIKMRYYRSTKMDSNSMKIFNALHLSLEGARRFLVDAVEEATLKYKSAEQENKKIAESLSKSLKTVYMGQKIKINSDLSITDKKGKTVVLSTGELKILNLMIFLEEVKKQQKSLIVLDDPLTSVDAENVDLFIMYLKSFLKETKMQAIFLTHSNTVLQSLFLYFDFDKKEKNSSLFYKWDLTDKYKVDCQKIEKIEPAINKYARNVSNKLLDIDFRLHNARRFFELLCLGVYGHNDFQRLIIKEKDKATFRFLNFEKTFNANTFKFLNSSSHGEIADNDDSLNLERNKRIALSEILQFMKEIGFKMHSNIATTRSTKII